MSVTSVQVKKIITTSIDDVTDPFINVAQNLVDEVLVNKGLSSTTLDSIVLYLSAHFVCLTEELGGLKRSRLGESDESYKTPGEKDVGFASTRYGMAAIMFDSTGTLGTLGANKGVKALFSVLKTPQKDYYEGL